MKPTKRAWLIMPACAFAGLVHAGELRLSPYVQYGATHNANLFSEPAQTARADNIERAAVGAFASWPISRQRATLAIEASRYRYQRFDALDHDEYDGRGAWTFEVGPLVYGVLSYDQRRYLQAFDNRDTREPDFIVEKQPEVDAYIAVTPDWQIHTRAGLLELDHSLDSERGFDREETSALAEVLYTGKPGSTVGAGAEIVDGRYPGREADGPLARDFVQRTPFLRLDWKYSGMSRFEARTGYTQRENGGGSDRDFTGATGRLAYIHTISPMTNITFEVSRQIFSVDDVDANYVQDTGGQIALDWDYGPNVTLSVIAARRKQDYQTLAQSASRIDTINRLESELTWRATPRVSLIFNASIIDRQSDFVGESYTQKLGGLAVRFTLDPQDDT